MRVLLLDAYDCDDPDRAVVAAAVGALSDRGHEVDRLDLWGTDQFMSAAEHAAYHSEEPIISDDVRDSVDRLREAGGLLFCYPTTAFTVPARLKGWLERTMVPGVGFVFDRNNRIRRAMTNIRRVGSVTTSPHGRMARMRARDGGRRTTVRTMRLCCHTRCRVTFVSLPAGAGAALGGTGVDGGAGAAGTGVAGTGAAETGAAGAGAERIRRALRRW